jgi:hypothetical protein
MQGLVMGRRRLGPLDWPGLLLGPPARGSHLRTLCGLIHPPCLVALRAHPSRRACQPLRPPTARPQAHPADVLSDRCIICGSGEEQGLTDWIACDSCESWVHFSCDKRAGLGTFASYSGEHGRTYTCPSCTRTRGPGGSGSGGRGGSDDGSGDEGEEDGGGGGSDDDPMDA